MTFSHVNLLHSLVIYSSVFGNLTLDVHHCSLFLWLSCSKILSSSITIKSICKSSLPTVMDIICLFIYVLYLSCFFFFFFFAVTLDYKALTMLIKRKDNGTESVETLSKGSGHRMLYFLQSYQGGLLLNSLFRQTYFMFFYMH